MNREVKYKKNMRCLDKWLSNLEDGKHIADYLNTFQIRRIGIYGYGILGKHLVRELKSQGLSVSWVADRSASADDSCDYVVKPADLGGQSDVDIVIIAMVVDVEEVEALLLKYVTGKIICIEELIDSVYVWGNQN